MRLSFVLNVRKDVSGYVNDGLRRLSTGLTGLSCHERLARSLSFRVPRTTLHIGIDLVLSAHEIADHESGSITGWKSCDRPVFNNGRASSAIKTAFVPVSAKARGISDVLLNLNPIQLSLFSSVHNTHRPFRVPIDINELRGLSVYEVGLDVCLRCLSDGLPI